MAAEPVESTPPAYGVLREVTPIASVMLARNPSPMTLEGTNTWVLRAAHGTTRVIVDPGDDDLAHLRRLAALRPVGLILLTHHHNDHVAGANWLAEQVGALVRAFDPALCRGAGPLVDGEVIVADGLRIRVLHTPGHTHDSVTLLVEHPGHSLKRGLEQSGGRPLALTGDTVLGHGTTVLADLGGYLASLATLIDLPDQTLGLPGHGPELANLPHVAREYLAHRMDRLNQIRAVMRSLGDNPPPRRVVELVYGDLDQSLWPAAEQSVRAQLDYLRDNEYGPLAE